MEAEDLTEASKNHTAEHTAKISSSKSLLKPAAEPVESATALWQLIHKGANTIKV